MKKIISVILSLILLVSVTIIPTSVSLEAIAVADTEVKEQYSSGDVIYSRNFVADFTNGTVANGSPLPEGWILCV